MGGAHKQFDKRDEVGDMDWCITVRPTVDGMENLMSTHLRILTHLPR